MRVKKGWRAEPSAFKNTRATARLQNQAKKRKRMLRLLRRFTLLLLALLVPVYAVSLMEDLETPAVWNDIRVGDTHAQVRERLRASGMADQQCEWLPSRLIVRCTLVGRHHAAGLAIRFDAAGAPGRVAEVLIHPTRYTGPFHLHARLRQARP